jgi:peptide/nickel transport system permease protein
MRRVAQHLLVLWSVATLAFVLPRLMPGNPLALLAGADITTIAPAERAALLAEAGLDRPWAVQYATYLSRLARGDLGRSYQRRQPVAALLVERLPWTLLLTLTSQVAAAGAGLGLGLLAAWWRHGGRGKALLVLFVVLESVPPFWIGLLLVATAGASAGLPTFGATTPGGPAAGMPWAIDVARHLLLPAVTLALSAVSSAALVVRGTLLDLIGEPFVTAARARGASTWRALTRHVLRAGLPPLTTALALNLGLTVAGATVVETVFSYPGLGRLAYEAVLSRDYPVLQGAVLLLTATVVAANALADWLLARLDPRTAEVVAAAKAAA